MSTPISMEWVIYTEGKERRVNAEDNLFEMVMDGYKLFPLNEPLEIKRNKYSKIIGSGSIEELVLKNHTTTCKYRLLSLYSVN